MAAEREIDAQPNIHHNTFRGISLIRPSNTGDVYLSVNVYNDLNKRVSPYRATGCFFASSTILSERVLSSQKRIDQSTGVRPVKIVFSIGTSNAICIRIPE